jgi:DNA polymerase-3 subunit delta
VWGDDEAARLQAALADLVTPSLFGGPSVLVVRRAEALPGAVEDAVAALVPQLDARARLVLVAKALDQRRRLHAAWAKAGATVGFARPEPRAVAGWVGTLARERGHSIAPAAVERLIDRAGLELARLDDEIEKLSLALGAGAAIDVRHVDALVATTRARAIEELTDRLARRDLGGAVRALRSLVAAGEAPLRVLAFVASNLRRALHVSELLASGLPESEVAGRLGMPPWLVSRQANRGTPEALEAALAALAELDVALKSSRPEEAAFESVLLEIARCAPDGRRVSS